MNHFIQICEPEQIGNDWGFYVDIELPHIHNNKHGFVTNKYSKNYYKCYDKIDEELEYYENEYNKKMENEYNKNEATPIVASSYFKTAYQLLKEEKWKSKD